MAQIHRKPLFALLGLLVAIASCNEVFDFDPLPLKTVSVVEGCTAATCPFEHEDNCVAGMCPPHCERGRKCLGSCGDKCLGQCEGTSKCALTAGANSTANCEGGASCEFKMGAGSSVNCKDGSECYVVCEGACGLTCGTTAICHLACGIDARSTVVSGTANCN